MLGQNAIYESLLGKKILLVDDEKDIGDLLEKVLKKDGFRNILKASSGQEATVQNAPAGCHCSRHHASRY